MKTNRRGVVCVEFAIVLPLFVIVFLGMIELGRGFIVQQVLTNAAREGARYAALQNSTAAGVQSLVTTYLTQANLPTSSVTITTGDPTKIITGSPVQVSVSIPFKSVSWLPVGHYLNGVTLSATAVFAKEGIYSR